MFHSYAFILAFLPLCLIGYFLLNHFRRFMGAKIFLIGMSLLFYAYMDLPALGVLAVSLLIGYLFFIQIRRSVRPKTWCILGVIFHVLTLCGFKYANFFLDCTRSVMGLSDDFTVNILLPVGISFYTFQQIAFLVDTYRGETMPKTPAHKGAPFVNYLLFMTYFPKISSGPLANYQDLTAQFDDPSRKKANAKKLSEGATLFILGLAKKVLLANVFALITAYGQSHVGVMGIGDTILVMVSYYFQIYFDFSGYCDMAVGVSRMLGIDLPYNFESPYKSFTMREFWKRWHITLTAFLTKYIYIPLGGSKKGTTRLIINVLLVFAISGLWHGAGLGFIIWGLMGGVGILLSRAFDKQIRVLSTHIPGKVFLWLCTFIYLCVGWTFFMCGDITNSVGILSGLGNAAGGLLPSGGILSILQTGEIWYVLKMLHLADLSFGPYIPIVLYLVAGFVITLLLPTSQKYASGMKPRIFVAILLSLLLLCSFLHLSGVVTYIYYAF